jgi:hypothetical protein
MAREIRPHLGGPCRLENRAHVVDDGLPVGYLLQDPDLHVIDEQPETLRAAHVAERLRDVETVEPIHARHPTGRSNRRPRRGVYLPTSDSNTGSVRRPSNPASPRAQSATSGLGPVGMPSAASASSLDSFQAGEVVVECRRRGMQTQSLGEDLPGLCRIAANQRPGPKRPLPCRGHEALHGRVDAQNKPPDGLIFHSAGPLEDGWGLIDFWESRAHFDRFTQERLQPALPELGDQAPSGPPDIKEFPVYNFVKPE